MAVKCGCPLQVITGRSGTLRVENLSLLDMLKIQRHSINTTMLLKSDTEEVYAISEPRKGTVQSACTYISHSCKSVVVEGDVWKFRECNAPRGDR